MTTTLHLETRVIGARLKRSDVDRLIATSTEATDTMGNSLRGDGTSYVGAPAPYRQVWRAVHVPGRGYAFVEVSSGSGIAGFASTLRGLVIKSIRPHIHIELMSDDDVRFVPFVIPLCAREFWLPRREDLRQLKIPEAQ